MVSDAIDPFIKTHTSVPPYKILGYIYLEVLLVNNSWQHPACFHDSNRGKLNFNPGFI